MRLVNDFEKFKLIYKNIPVSSSIYSKIIYIHLRKTDIDVDNMSKPFIDAFRNIIYTDDSVIDHRICTKISYEDFETIDIDISSLPDKVLNEFDNLIQNRAEHILYFEVGDFNNSMIKVGEENDN